MPAGLADAVLAVIARARDVPAVEASAIARLAAPDDAVAEVQLDPPGGTLAPVIGFAAHGTRSLLTEAAADAAPNAPDTAPDARTSSATDATNAAPAPALSRWLDAIAPHASHWGMKLGPTRQLYARGRFDAAFAAALGAGAPAELARLLAATGASWFAMLGVDLAGGAIARQVGYVAVSEARAATALAAARGVTTGITGSAADDLALLAAGQAWMHLSWDLATSAGPFKADVGARQASEAIAIATRLGLDGAALASRLPALGLGDPSHVGLRLGVEPGRALALYFRVTAS